MFGHPTRGDERILLRLDPNGDAHIAHDSNTAGTELRLVSGWSTRRNTATFSDTVMGREFVADLTYTTLGGRWQDPLRSGGWWCLPAPNATTVVSMPALIPGIMATPWYPRRAIRAAQEGHAVACFTVSADGAIEDPVLIELSDEIFLNPILSALQRSRYARWNGAIPARPGCRSFSFELESIFR